MEKANEFFFPCANYSWAPVVTSTTVVNSVSACRRHLQVEIKSFHVQELGNVPRGPVIRPSRDLPLIRSVLPCLGPYLYQAAIQIYQRTRSASKGGSNRSSTRMSFIMHFPRLHAVREVSSRASTYCRVDPKLAVASPCP